MESHSAIAPEVSDIVLITNILNGEKRLFEHIIRRYNQRLYRMGMSVLNDDVAVEDAMQTAYIKTYQHLSQFEHRASFATWITRIMLNECLAVRNKKTPILSGVDISPEKAATMATPSDIMMNRELAGVLEHAIAQLPEKYRLVFVLREVEQMSVKETGDTLGIGMPNVKVRLNRAKTMLRASLGGYMKDQVYAFHLSRCDCMVATVMAQLGIY